MSGNQIKKAAVIGIQNSTGTQTRDEEPDRPGLAALAIGRTIRLQVVRARALRAANRNTLQARSPARRNPFREQSAEATLGLLPVIQINAGGGNLTTSFNPIRRDQVGPCRVAINQVHEGKLDIGAIGGQRFGG